MKKWWFTWVFLIVTLCAQMPNSEMPDPVEEELVVSVETFKPGQSFWVAVNLKIEDHWHTYWKNPGSSGLKTSITWKLPEGVTASEIHWVSPEWIESSGLVSLAYEHEAPHLVEITVAENFSQKEITLAGTAEWLVCTDEGPLAGCYPGNGDFKVKIPLGEEQKQNKQTSEFFKNAQKRMPHTVNNWQILSNRQGDKINLFFIPPQGFDTTLSDVKFFPEQEIYQIEEPQKLSYKDGVYQLQISLGDNVPENLTEISGILHSEQPWSNEANKSWLINTGVLNSDLKIKDIKELIATSKNEATQEGSETNQKDSFIWLVWLNIYGAFIGGIILNAMPCVLPVIALKIFGFVEEAGGDKSKIWKSGVLFTAGVIVTFWVLVGVLFAIREVGLFGINDANLSWGYQLQSPTFVFIVSVLFLTFALNLFGVFEVGTSLTTLGGASKKSGPMASFSTGVLTTIVATPCSAPFMATAVGFAMAQSKIIAFTIFTSLAMGLAFPYLIISIFPSLLKFLPKPGRWMESFKKLLGFPLLGAAAWLFAVFVVLVANDLAHAFDITMYSLIGFTFLSLGLWTYGRWGNVGNKNSTRAVASLMALTFVVGGFYIGYSYIPTEAEVIEAQKQANMQNGNKVATDKEWRSFYPQEVEKLITEGKPVFIDFTAAWCLTCQVNKKVALRTDEVTAKFKELGVVTISADWTKRTPVIGEYLKKFKRNSVPVYVFYYNKKGDYTLLPQILTPGIVIEELEKRLKR